MQDEMSVILSRTKNGNNDGHDDKNAYKGIKKKS